MTISVNAIYERGAFRPTEPIVLQEGAEVTLAIQTPEDMVPAQKTREMIEEIAALPPEGPNDGFSGADHDKILYGPEGAW